MGWDREIEMSDQEEKEATENLRGRRFTECRRGGEAEITNSRSLLSGIQAQNTTAKVTHPQPFAYVSYTL